MFSGIHVFPGLGPNLKRYSYIQIQVSKESNILVYVIIILFFIK